MLAMDGKYPFLHYLLCSNFFRFKVQNEGFVNGVWGTETVIKNQGKQVIHIPECIANGQYLLRPEMIALHGARTAGGAQLYVSLFFLETDDIV